MLPEFLKLILLAWAFAFALMAVVWFISVRIANAGIVDIAWSLGFAPVALLYAVLADGYAPRRWLIFAMASLWSLRLGIYLYFRVMGHHPQEDRRYAELRREWGANVNGKMFGFFQLQAALLVVLSVPFLLACLNPEPQINPLEWLGLAVWFVAVVGESLSDHQLKQFKKNPANKGEVCQAGLWHYSRHPNYFFEWLIWVAFFLFALGSPIGCVSVYCPALMLYFLVRVTGIPMTEDLAVKTKGEKYLAYQRTTSRFVPWFPKHDSNAPVKNL
jgi:steroid 5-alpha reductase family enzyme